MPVLLPFLLLAGVLGASGARADDTCWDQRAGEELSVAGIVESVDQFDDEWSIVTEIDIGGDCSIWEVFGSGKAPGGCAQGDRITTRGVIDVSDDMVMFFGPEDNIVGLRAASISCE